MICGVVDPATNEEFTVGFVYGNNCNISRRQLWEEILSVSSSPIMANRPLILLGDFNQIMSIEEHFSVTSSHIPLSNLNDLRSCLDESNLTDIPGFGATFTWTNCQPVNPVLRKLDRVVVNDCWMSKFPNSFAVFDPSVDSDHSPCLVSMGLQGEKRRKPFKFFNFITSHPNYLTNLTLEWSSQIFDGSAMFILAKKLKHTKSFCRNLNYSCFGDIPSRSRVAFQALEDVQRRLLSQPNPQLFLQETEARENWNFMARGEELFYKQKSRIQWLNEGDSNTSFFHRACEVNNSVRGIKYLRNVEGVRITDIGVVKAQIVQHFKNLLGTPHSEVQPMSVFNLRDLLPYRCPDHLKVILQSIPTAADVQKTVFDMPKNKAPGPDGFPVEFFISAWSIVGGDVIKAVLEFFTSKNLLKQFNATSICLIPKVSGADSIANFRPISCCNTFYKIISRLLAKKIQLFISEAVQRNQVGFIKDRLLCENVLLASELVSDFHKDGPITRGCLKVDISKAYDNLNWDFVLNILRALDLPAELISWIKECITTPSFSIAINGDLEGYFRGKKGLRQGDPISSYLFVLAMDVLAKKLDAMIASPGFTPHPLCSEPLITHLSFADDVLVFFDGSTESLQVIMDVFEEFSHISGLKISLPKSTLILDGNHLDLTREMADRYGLQQGCLPVKYLGVPLTSHKLSQQDFQPLIDKVHARLTTWAVRKLSFAGRVQLLSSVIWSLINFWSSMFILPTKCLKKLEQLCSAFLWKGSLDSAKGAKISWEKVCQPKASGGLGLRRLANWNIIFGLKLIWLLFSRAGSLWVSWVKAHLIRGRCFWDLNGTRGGSWIWQKLCKLRHIARQFIRCSIGNGLTSLFWHDRWCDLGPLIHLVGTRGPPTAGLNSSTKVAEAVLSGSWRLSNRRNPIISCLRTALPAALELSASPYVFSWIIPALNSTPESKGFTASRVWDFLNPILNEVLWHTSIWFKGSIPKHSFTSWVSAWDRLPTGDRLISWGLITTRPCLLCNVAEESRDHIFFMCTFSASIWNSFMDALRLNPPTPFNEILLWLSSPLVIPAKVRTIAKLVFQASVYELWRERNGRFHRQEARQDHTIIAQISQALRTRLAYLSRHSQAPPRTNSNNNESLLLLWIRLVQMHAPIHAGST